MTLSEKVEVITKTALLVGYMVFEWWLGKTKRVNSNSTLELISGVIKRLIHGGQ